MSRKKQPVMGRRRNGEGSFRRVIKNGKEYVEGRIWINGKSHSVSGKSEKECQEKIDRLRFFGVQKKTKKITVWEQVERWIESDVKMNHEESTYSNYKVYAEKHIKPEFSKKMLSDITRLDIQNWINKKSTSFIPGKSRTYSASTIRKMFLILAGALKSAVIDDIIDRNPADLVKKPTIERKKHILVESSYIERIINFDTGKDQLTTMSKIILLTGLRRGEALGLQWSDIDFENRIISIWRSVVKGDDKILIKNPKTKNSIREVPIPKHVIPILKNHKKVQQELKKDAGEFYKDRNFVFSNGEGNCFYPDSARNGVKRLLNAVGAEKTTVHSLRHSYASILYELGEDDKVIQSVLGHASIKTTMDTYVHLKKSQKETAANKLDDLIEKQKKMGNNLGK